MTFAKQTACLASAVMLFSATAVFAQAGGGDVPSNAKQQGTKENGPGTTGMSKGEADAGGKPTTTEKGSASGGNAGGAAGRQ